MGDWLYRSDLRDPLEQLIQRESSDCHLTKCAHVSTVFGIPWCEVRERQYPFNHNCEFFEKR